MFVLLNFLILGVVSLAVGLVAHLSGALQLPGALRWVVPLGAALALVILGLLFWAGRRLRGMSAPFQSLFDASQRVAAGDFSARAEERGFPEVRMLARAFNRMAARLQITEEQRRELLAEVSHELRTPLTVIKGNVGLIRKLGEADEESLEGIEQEVDRLTRMVGDLLLLAQAESGRLPLALAPVEIDTLLLEVFQQMRLVAGEKIQMRMTEIDQVQAVGDPDRLKQVLLNLVGNAIQYTPPGGTVSLVLRKTGTQAQIIINDTGPGIPAADLPHIFERFYRGEKSRKRSGAASGYGLGLSIAYWIVKAHGGTIEVSSQEGKGSTFCVWLPLSGPPPRAEETK
jgi:signal transduction histidine kinase